MKWKRLDLKWKRFWELLVLWFSHMSKSKCHSSYWNCLCSCWNKICVRWVDLIWWQKYCKNCCWKWIKKHWLSHTKINRAYKHLNSRCNNKNDTWYKNYWWRWIKNEWNGFWEFLDDMYDSYLKHIEKYWEKNTTIDRIDNNGNYCKENCRWATKKEQWNNKRNNIILTYNWKSQTLPNWCRNIWIQYKRAIRRYELWMSVDDILYDWLLVNRKSARVKKRK